MVLRVAALGLVLGSLSVGSLGASAQVSEPKIALLQFDGDSYFGQAERNRAEQKKMAEEAVAEGAKIIVLPEGSTHGYADASQTWCLPEMESCADRTCRDVNQVAEKVPGGETSEFWQAFSIMHGVYVAYSVPELDQGRYYNTLGVAGPKGHVTKYRKRSLYYIDKCYAERGEQAQVLRTPYGNFGLMICLDGMDPPKSYFEEYRQAQVDGVILSMDWDDDPNGPYAARTVFQKQAEKQRLVIYASDTPAWDGTGKYLMSGQPRERNGLAPIDIGTGGMSLHLLK
jgi:N-carbamoylputrescine amidase